MKFDFCTEEWMLLALCAITGLLCAIGAMYNPFLWLPSGGCGLVAWMVVEDHDRTRLG